MSTWKRFSIYVTASAGCWGVAVEIILLEKLVSAMLHHLCPHSQKNICKGSAIVCCITLGVYNHIQINSM